MNNFERCAVYCQPTQNMCHSAQLWSSIVPSLPRSMSLPIVDAHRETLAVVKEAIDCENYLWCWLWLCRKLHVHPPSSKAFSSSKDSYRCSTSVSTPRLSAATHPFAFIFTPLYHTTSIPPYLRTWSPPHNDKYQIHNCSISYHVLRSTYRIFQFFELCTNELHSVQRRNTTTLDLKYGQSSRATTIQLYCTRPPSDTARDTRFAKHFWFILRHCPHFMVKFRPFTTVQQLLTTFAFTSFCAPSDIHF